MALDFPASPTNGQLDSSGQWTYNSTKQAWQAVPLTQGKTVTSPTPPSSPQNGDQWFNTNDGTLYIYYTDANTSQWVESRAPVTADGYQSPNYIINGAMDIWQRGTSVTVSSGYGYGPDRWRGYSYASNSFTMSQQAFTPGTIPVAGCESAYFLRIRGTNTRVFIETPIEDVRTLAGQTATVSFWAKASASSTLTSHIFQNFGSGGSTTVTDIIRINNSLTTSWQKFTTTLSMPSVAGKTIGTGSYAGLELTSLNLNTDIDIWGVQLESGTTATPFRRNANSLQGELAACQRYYYRMTNLGGAGRFAYGNCSSTVSWSGTAYVPVAMRVFPAISAGGAGNGYISDGQTGRGTFTWAGGGITRFDVTAVNGFFAVPLSLTTTGLAALTGGWLEASSGTTQYIEFSAEL